MNDKAGVSILACSKYLGFFTVITLNASVGLTLSPIFLPPRVFPFHLWMFSVRVYNPLWSQEMQPDGPDAGGNEMPLMARMLQTTSSSADQPCAPRGDFL